MSLFQVLLLVHVLGAIVGIGPTFGYSVLGPLSAKLGGPGGLAIMEGMVGIERRLVNPVVLITQPLTGILMITTGSWGADFFAHTWLLVSIVLYAVILILIYGVNNPAFHKMVDLGKAGNAQSDEFANAAKRIKPIGPIVTLLAIAIVFLMVIKPGG